jgi:Na+/H+ antiporter NhaD/arsenite permease-like protein
MPALQEPQQYKPLAEKSMEHMPIRIEGAHNFIFLAGILGSILVSGAKSIGGLTLFHIEFGYFDLLRDIFILLMGYLSIKFTSKAVRTDNDFSWEPIKEVGYLFFGIFVTIIPVLMMLKAGTSGHLGSILELVNTPGKYFWVTGGLSSFLDNAPTYYSFFTLALGQLGLTEPEASGILRGTFDHARSAEFIAYLKAISCGAVFMGANTYIGNAPNILVKSIAEDFKEGAVNMPGHLKYMAWSICLLIPCFLVVWLIFF